MAYTEKTAELDPIVQAAVSAACRDAIGPMQVMQAKSYAAIELATKAAHLAADESAAALSIEINALIRAQTHAAATEIAHAFTALRESKTDTLVEPDEDLPPHVGFPLSSTMAPGCSLPSRNWSIAALESHHPAGGGWGSHTLQFWNIYGDTMRGVQAADPHHPYLSVGGSCSPIGMRPKLTREYQEIMWAVAQKMDASFLRPIFDKYNPRAAQHVALQARERAVSERETAVAARERDADEKAAGAAVWEAGVILEAKTEATKAADLAHAGHLAAIALRETEMSRRARELDDREAKHIETCVAHRARADLERAGLAAQSQAVTMRLRAAISEETDRLLTADRLRRADELQTMHEALRETVYEIAHEICADALAPVEYGSRLFAALGESE